VYHSTGQAGGLRIKLGNQVVFWLCASSWYLSLYGFAAWLANLLDNDGVEG
jgi:hypothetical protein